MKRSLWIVTLFLVGCAQTTVHLNSRYLDEADTQEIIGALESEGFATVVNEHPFPQQVIRTTLLHSPTMMIRSPEVIEHVHTIVSDLGWNLQQLDGLAKSNHRFTGNNLGLFIVPAGVNVRSGNSAADLSQTYQSSQCPDVFQITLLSDGQFEFIKTDPEPYSFKGEWQLNDYPYIVLSQQEPHLNFYYQVEQTQVQDRLSSIQVITLKPLSKSPRIPDCSLEYGIRN